MVASGGFRSVGLLVVRSSISAFLLGTVFPQHAKADDANVSHVVAGTWQSSDFPGSENPGCSIGSDGSVPGGRIVLGASRHRPSPMNMVIKKLGWAIPAGIPVQIRATFSNGSTMVLAGRGNSGETDFDLDDTQVPAFMHNLTASTDMQVFFPGSEPVWHFDLAGTSKMVGAMGDCFLAHQVVGVAPPFAKAFANGAPDASGVNTQPFGSTQPFAAPSSNVTQPFANNVTPSYAAPVAQRIVPTAQYAPAGDVHTEQMVLDAIAAAKIAYANGTSDMAKGAARPMRAKALCAAFGNSGQMMARNWTGKITELTTNGDGAGVVGVEIGPNVTIKTHNNSFSDIGSNTLIGPSSALFQAALALHVGQRVRFSGTFFPSRSDCITEGSMSMDGSITEPEFIMQFSDISPN